MEIFCWIKPKSKSDIWAQSIKIRHSANVKNRKSFKTLKKFSHYKDIINCKLGKLLMSKCEGISTENEIAMTGLKSATLEIANNKWRYINSSSLDRTY